MYDLGHSVVGIEGVVEPIIQFFTEQKLEYHMEVIGTSPCYSVSTALPLHLFHSSHFSCIITDRRWEVENNSFRLIFD